MAPGDQLPLATDRQDRKSPVPGQMFPPGVEPLPGQEQAIRIARLQKLVPLLPQCRESRHPPIVSTVVQELPDERLGEGRSHGAGCNSKRSTWSAMYSTWDGLTS